MSLQTTQNKNILSALLKSVFTTRIGAPLFFAAAVFFAGSAAGIGVIASSQTDSGVFALAGLSSPRPKVLGLASSGDNQPVCGYNTANCLNHVLLGYNGQGWQARINYQLSGNVTAAIKVNSWPFMDNLRGPGGGTGYTGYDLLPGNTYRFILYSKVGSRLGRRLTTLDLTMPPAPEPNEPTSPPILVEYPNGGEKISFGDNIQIQWSGVNLNYLAHIYLIPCANAIASSCGNGLYNLAANQPNSGSFNWQAQPTDQNGKIIPAGYYLARVEDNRGISDDKSDAPFMISAAPARTGNYGTDSDNSPDYSISAPNVNAISPQRYPDLFVKGAARGVYSGCSPLGSPACNVIYGADPNPATVKPTSDNFPTYNDYCQSLNQLNEAYVRRSDGQIAAHGFPAPYGYMCQAGAFVSNASVAPRPGQLVNINGTVYLVGQGGLYGFPDLNIFNSWGYSFSSVVLANTAETALPRLGLVPYRNSACTNPVSQIAGRCSNISLSSPGSVTQTLAPASPAARSINMGSPAVPLAVFRLTETTGKESVNLSSITFNLWAVAGTTINGGRGALNSLANFSLGNGAATFTKTSYDAGASDTSGSVAYSLSFQNISINIPAGGSVDLTLSGDIKSFVNGAASGAIFTPSIQYAVLKGSSSQASIGLLFTGAAPAVTVVNPAGSSSSASQTASLRANGQQNITVNVGDAINYVWAAANAESVDSYYWSDKPDTCGNGNSSPSQVIPWVANTASGLRTTTVLPCQAGVTYTITYRAYKYGAPQVYVLSVVTLTVNGSSSANSPTATLTANGAANLTVNVGNTINYLWSAANADSADSYYSANRADACGYPGPPQTLAWPANNVNGSRTTTVQQCQAGVTYTITYRAYKNGGGFASSVVTLTVNP